MGYYIEVGTNHNKAEIICDNSNGVLIPRPQ